MPINPDAVGSKGDPIAGVRDSKDWDLRALRLTVGIGAGTPSLPPAPPPPPPPPPSSTPLSPVRRSWPSPPRTPSGVEQRVFPTFPVVIGWGAGSAMANIGEFNWAMLVHGQQSVTLHQPIPVEGTATLQSEIVAIHDKGKAAVVVSAHHRHRSAARPLSTTTSSAFIRGEGGWGGDRGPSGPQNVPPDRAPDHQVTYQTSPDQALVYRLSGDRNPLHSDPAFAAMGGFDRPILHGLCTYGFTGRALLHTLCDSDPARFAHVEGRFASPVFPGEALTVSMWEVDGVAIFQTAGDDGRTVIDAGKLTYQPG